MRDLKYTKKEFLNAVNDKLIDEKSRDELILLDDAYIDAYWRPIWIICNGPWEIFYGFWLFINWIKLSITPKYLLFINFKHISHLFLVFLIIDFEQVNVSWVDVWLDSECPSIIYDILLNIFLKVVQIFLEAAPKYFTLIPAYYTQ